MNTIGKKKV